MLDSWSLSSATPGDPQRSSRTRGSTLGRLRLLAGCAVVATLVSLGLGLVDGLDDHFGRADELAVRRWFTAAVLAASLFVLGVSATRIAARRILALGAAWYVLVVLALVAIDTVGAHGDRAFAQGIPTASAFVMVFQIVVGLGQRHFLGACLVSLALVPAILFVVPRLVANPPASPEAHVLIVVPLAASMLGAYLASRFMRHFGQDLARPRRAGSYQLIGPLGQGGMGEVWHARHSDLERDAAVKLIRRDEADGGDVADAVQCLAQEARLVSGLRSPHTIQLYDFGVADDGSLYYAMEMLEGMDLDRLVALHGPLDPARVIQFLLQACHSLAEAHESGVVHRDIKPGNLFAAKLGRDVDVLKLLDFGLATRPLQPTPAESELAQCGIIRGTPGYMAPEQVRGERSLDGRADLYALGAVGWFLLTGRDVFQTSNHSQVMFAHTHVEAEPPSRYAPRAIPVELDQAILWCLAKDPDARPATAEALAERLRAIELAEPWDRSRALAWWAQHGAPTARRAAKHEALAPTWSMPEHERA